MRIRRKKWAADELANCPFYINDPNIAALIKKHFNAVTLENELKPEALMNIRKTEKVARVDDEGVEVKDEEGNVIYDDVTEKKLVLTSGVYKK